MGAERQADGPIRLVVSGDCNVGKTSLVTALAHGVFNDHTEITLGTDICPCTLEVDGVPMQLQVFVLPGQGRFAQPTYYNKAHGVVVLYDIAAAETFDHVAHWLEKVPNRTVAMVVGNKCDLEARREVPCEVAEKFALQHNLLHMETSAKTHQNVAEVFREICRAVRDQSPRAGPPPIASAVVPDLDPHPNLEASCRCVLM
jgi:small GTP-binding protein